MNYSVCGLHFGWGYFLKVATLVLTACVSSLRAEVVMDFEAGLKDWKSIGAGQVMSSLLGNAYYAITVDKGGSGQILSPSIPTGENRQMAISFRSRSTIAHSSRESGSLVTVSFMGEGGRPVGRETILCPVSIDWVTTERKLAVPLGAKALQVQCRLLQTSGTASWDDVKIELSPESLSGEDSTVKSYHLLTDFQLDLKTRELTAGSQSLPDISKDRAESVYRYILPDAFCESDDLIYEIDISFTPGWKSVSDVGNYPLFSLGSNILGALPQSFCMMVYEGKKLVSRVNGAVPRIKADIWERNVNTMLNPPLKAKVRVNAKGLTTFYNDVFIGDNFLPSGSFIWGKSREFVVGGDVEGRLSLPGKINEFHLRIYEPNVKARLSGGSRGGYFTGAGAHVWPVEFPKGDGDKVQSLWEVIGADGKKVLSTLKPTQTAKSTHELTIPAIPYGFYTIKGKLKGDLGVSALEKSFVVTPVMERGPVETAFFGIQHEFPLKPGEFDPVYVEEIFMRSAAAGNRWFRLWTSWDDFETEKGKYNWEVMDQVVALAQKHGLKLYPCLLGGRLPFQTGKQEKSSYALGLMGPNFFYPADMPAWQEMLSTMAKRYQGKITAYEIWNESDARNGLYPFDPKAYVEILKAASEAIRSVDKNIKIGLSGFCAAMMDDYLYRTTYTPKDSAWGARLFYAYNPGPYFDITDLHYYSFNEPRQSWDRNVQVVKEGKAYLATIGEQNKPIWNSETGFCSGPAGVVGGYGNVPYLSHIEHAARIVQWHVQSMVVGIQRNFYYQLCVNDSGIVNSDFSPKPAYAALVNAVRLLQEATFVSEEISRGTLRVYKFQRGDEQLLIAWTTEGRSVLSLDGVKAASCRVVDLMGNEARVTAPYVELTEMPVYILSCTPLGVQPLVEVKDLASSSGKAQAEVELCNPAAQSTRFKVSCLLSGCPPQLKEVEVPSKSKKQLQFTFDAAGGYLQVEVLTEGGMQQQMQLSRNILARKWVDLSSRVPAELLIDQKEQVKVGGFSYDLQGREIQSLWNGGKDVSARITLSQAEGKIQFGIKVQDDVVVPAAEGKKLYEGDAVELFLDLNPLGKNARTNVYQVIISADGRIYWAHDRKAPGFMATANRTQEGYMIDGSFDQPSNACFGLNIAVDDADAATGRKTQSIWTGTEATIAHSEEYGVISLTTDASR